MKKLLLTLLACVALGLAAVGCGGDDGDSGDEATPTTQQPAGNGGGEAGAGGAKAGEAVSVDVVDIDYEPREATVPKGGTITWTNTGDLPHTVTKDSGPGGDFDSGTLNNGDEFEQTFDTAGTIEYVCRIHPQQRGTITVE